MTDEVKSISLTQSHNLLITCAIAFILVVFSFTAYLTSIRMHQSQALRHTLMASEQSNSYLIIPTPTLYPCTTIAPTPAHRIIAERPWPTVFIYVTPTSTPTPTPWTVRPLDPTITFGPSPTRGPTGGSAPLPRGTKGTPPTITPSPLPLPTCPF